MGLQKQKELFQTVLVRELKEEIRFLWNVKAGRAERRKLLSEKVIEGMTQFLTMTLSVASVAGPEAKAIATGVSSVVKLAGLGVQKLVSANDKARLGHVASEFADIDYKLELYLRQFASIVTFRYEQIMAKLLSENPSYSVIPLAEIGARRVMEYLNRFFNEDKSIVELENQKKKPLIELMLDGLIQGYSGKFHEGPRDNNDLKDLSGKSLSVEGVYGRGAMRLFAEETNIQDYAKWPIYYTLEAQHTRKGIKAKFTKKHWVHWGEVRFTDGDMTKGLKYGYMMVDEATQNRYGYHDKSSEVLNNRPENQYLPSVYHATAKEVLDYANDPDIDPKKVSFHEYIQDKVNQTSQKREILSIWARSEDFQAQTIEKGNFDQIDFSGSNFKGAKLKNASFYACNLAFIQAEGIQCEQVEFGQSEFGCSNLANATLTACNTKGASFVGANTKGMKEIASKGKTIEELKAEQEQAKHKAAQEKMSQSMDFLTIVQQLEAEHIEAKKAIPEIEVKKLKDSGAISQLSGAAHTLLEEIKNIKLHKAKLEAAKKTADGMLLTYLETKITDLQQTLDELQGKVNSITEKVLEDNFLKSFRVRILSGNKLGKGAEIKVGGSISANIHSVPASLQNTMEAMLKDIANYVEIEKEVLDDNELEEEAKITVKGGISTENLGIRETRAHDTSTVSQPDLFQPPKAQQFAKRIAQQMGLNFKSKPELNADWKEKKQSEKKKLKKTWSTALEEILDEGFMEMLSKLKTVEQQQACAALIAEELITICEDINELEIDETQVEDGFKKYLTQEKALQEEETIKLQSLT